MSERKQKPLSPTKFAVGAQVRVKRGVVDPEYPDTPLGGWLGSVAEVEEETYLVRWSDETLAAAHRLYRERCERDGADYGGMWFQKNE